jgi:hypothetical protein
MPSLPIYQAVKVEWRRRMQLQRVKGKVAKAMSGFPGPIALLIVVVPQGLGAQPKEEEDPGQDRDK